MNTDLSRSFPYSERCLQCAWFDAAWRPQSLQSTSGEKIVVEDPGRWNLEAGPDFLDAVLKIGPEQRRIQGDIEIHVRANEWKNHNHSNDSRYAHLIAHVTYFPGVLPDDDLPRNTVQISLKDALKRNPAFCFENIDVTAYPYATIQTKTPPCAEILTTWSPADRNTLLEAAGKERLKIKARRVAAGIAEHGQDQLLYEEIMCSLGYKHNRIPFRQLAHRVTLKSLHEETANDTIKSYSLLLGVAGLIPTKISKRWDTDTRSFVRLLWNNWWKQQGRWQHLLMPQKDWHLSGLRPQNHPIRRLAAAAALFTHPPLPTGERMPARRSLGAGGKVRGKNNSLKDELTSLDTGDPKSWFKKAESIFKQPLPFNYWNRHLSFSGKLQDSDIALIGSRRTSAILSNVVIPFLAALDIPVVPLLEHLPPEEDNHLIRQTAFTLFGRDHNPALYQKGLRQQGLLQIFHDFCLNNKTGCKDCPLASALKKA